MSPPHNTFSPCSDRISTNLADDLPTAYSVSDSANMSSRNREVQPSLLILSRAIYAKRSDDAFYPGTIESKQADDSYLVKFTDGAIERIEEHDITWLGFWGLPPWCWPRNPIVQTAGSANMDFLNGLSRNDNRKEHMSDSVPSKALFREGNDFRKRGNGLSERDIESDVPLRSQKTNGFAEELSTFEQDSAHQPPRQSSENHRRCVIDVVLFLCGFWNDISMLFEDAC